MKHSIHRTSPKGEPYVGFCPQCGKTGLTPADMNGECENPRGDTQEDALLRAIEGKGRT